MVRSKETQRSATLHLYQSACFVSFISFCWQWHWHRFVFCHHAPYL